MVCGGQARSQSKQSVCAIRYKPHSNISQNEDCLSTIVEIGNRRREACNARRYRQLQALGTEPTRPRSVVFGHCPTVSRVVLRLLLQAARPPPSPLERLPDDLIGLGFGPKTAAPTTKYTNHTKNEWLTPAGDRKLRVEDRENVRQCNGGQSHTGANVEGRMKNAERRDNAIQSHTGAKE